MTTPLTPLELPQTLSESPTPLDHVAPQIHDLLEADQETRFHFLDLPQFIGHAQIQPVMNDLEYLFHHPRIHRMPARVFVGQPFNGKTLALLEFLNQHKRSDANPERSVVTVLYFNAPLSPRRGTVYLRILEALGVPHDRRVRNDTDVEDLERKVRLQIKRLGVQLLLIDEGHNATSVKKDPTNEFSTMLKDLSNLTNVSIVVAGTDLLLSVLERDEQLSTRFDPLVLEPWSYNADFLGFLRALELTIPLRQPSQLWEPKSTLGRRILTMSEGITGHVTSIVREAAKYAIRKGIEQITDQVLTEIKWRNPSQRFSTARQLYKGHLKPSKGADKGTHG